MSAAPVEPGAEVVTLTAPGVRVEALPRAAAWARAALDAGDTLYEAARREHLSIHQGGRGPVYRVSVQDESWMVRHYRRGGALRGLWDDRYLRWGVPRPFREARVSRMLTAEGVPTPDVVAAAVYRSGSVYRGDLVTTLVPDATALLDVLADPGSSAPLALDLAGDLARRVAAAGVLHVDFNARNVLFTGLESRGLSGALAWILDLDRCRTGVSDIGGAEETMIARLERSLEKNLGAALPSEWSRTLREGRT